MTVEQEPHIVVVDDHRDIRDLVATYLSQHGYRVSMADGGGALREIIERDPANLIVLDIMMPGEDGLTVCRNLRAQSAVPVIFLTAMADDADRVTGLELGADDYLIKPFNPRELLARVRAVLRRTDGSAAMLERTSNIVTFDKWKLDLQRRELQSPDGVGVPLSTAEFRLLKVFIEHPLNVLSREQLLDLTVGRSADPFDRSIDNQVSRLRKKIEADPKSPTIIQTHWGGGYSLACKVAVQ